MFEETTDVVAVVRRIVYLEKEKQRIYDSEEYKLGKIAVNYDDESLAPSRGIDIENKLPIGFYYKDDEHKEIDCYIYGNDVRDYFPAGWQLITQGDLQNFVEENDLNVGSFREIAKRYGRDIMLKFFAYLKEKIAYMRNVHEKYTAKIDEINREIKSLKEKL